MPTTKRKMKELEKCGNEVNQRKLFFPSTNDDNINSQFVSRDSSNVDADIPLLNNNSSPEIDVDSQHLTGAPIRTRR